MVRRLVSNPRQEDNDAIEKKREALVSMFIHLKNLQGSAGVTDIALQQEQNDDNETSFDDKDQEASASAPAPAPAPIPGNIPVERHVISLPSNGNFSLELANIEINLRTKQAKTELTRIRDIIAQISFHYSHIIQGHNK